MPNLNHCVLIGHLTRDPEVKQFQNGGSICNFTVAVTRKWKGIGGKEGGEKTSFIDCKLNGKGGETFAQYTGKGDPVCVTGSIEQETWEKDGQKRSKLVVRVEQFQFLRGKGDGSKRESQPVAGSAIGEDVPDGDSIPF